MRTFGNDVISFHFLLKDFTDIFDLIREQNIAKLSHLMTQVFRCHTIRGKDKWQKEPNLINYSLGWFSPFW
jgi:hypothetical protein